MFATKSAFLTHQRREHPNGPSGVATSSGTAAQATPEQGTVAESGTSVSAEAARRSHICSLCNKGFTTSSNLHQHRRLHFNERPFQCNQCNKGFATSTNLKQHYRTHTGNDTLVCLLVFCLLYNILFQASIYIYRFRMLAGRRNQLRNALFSGDRPYPCMYCPKRFATNSNLRQHIRTHTGERPYICVYPGCGRGFNDATKLSNHHRTHTGERPFACRVCGHEFVTRNNLKSHLRSHYDPKGGNRVGGDGRDHAAAPEARQSAAEPKPNMAAGRGSVVVVRLRPASPNDGG